MKKRFRKVVIGRVRGRVVAVAAEAVGDRAIGRAPATEIVVVCLLEVGRRVVAVTLREIAVRFVDVRIDALWRRRVERVT